MNFCDASHFVSQCGAVRFVSGDVSKSNVVKTEGIYKNKHQKLLTKQYYTEWKVQSTIVAGHTWHICHWQNIPLRCLCKRICSNAACGAIRGRIFCCGMNRAQARCGTFVTCRIFLIAIKLFGKIFCWNVMCDVTKSVASDLAKYSAVVRTGPMGRQ